MIQYGRQKIVEEDIQAVISVLRSDFLTQGPMVPRFEEELCNYVGASNCVAVNSATSALHIACMALGIGDGDVVWTSPNTFVASANAAIYCGATVDFVDINPRTYNMSVEALECKLNLSKKMGLLPKAVIPVHYAGQSCEMERIWGLSKEFGFKIIEDASHAVGAEYQGGAVGNCRYSDITVFSFHPIKIITTGEGGCALTNDEKIAVKMRQARSHGITSDRDLMEETPADEIWNYQQVSIGYNYRMTDIAAALGISQLSFVEEFLEKRRTIARVFSEHFENTPIILPAQHPDTLSSFHLYPIRVPSSCLANTQMEVYKFLHGLGIIVNLHYIPVYLQPYFRRLGFKKGYCPESELFFKEAISIPIHPSLTKPEIEKIISALKKIVH